ncbi:hypothetical protein Ddye_009887 [Dipteronia dyeriana]|uniref:Protein kinase domain-containing protein n=1 Tax=Dipteronia dyeriana TaxID=168575 RepID=A0AAD9XC86_9ROSI|nr:hypothetical protein Ddye_009887 [Dipteronia dyeriana]
MNFRTIKPNLHTQINNSPTNTTVATVDEHDLGFPPLRDDEQVADDHDVTTFSSATRLNTSAGHLNAKSDVYSFSIMLLELLTGFKAVDTSRRKNNLVEWLKPIFSQNWKLQTIMDGRMEGQHSSKATSHAAQLILKCLSIDPKDRPSMKEVMEVLVQIQAMTFMKKVPEVLEQIKVMEEKLKKSKFSSPQCSIAPRHRQPRRFLTSLKASCQYVSMKTRKLYCLCKCDCSGGISRPNLQLISFDECCCGNRHVIFIGDDVFKHVVDGLQPNKPRHDTVTDAPFSTPNPASADSAPPFCSTTATNVKIQRHFQAHVTIKKMLATPHLKEFSFKELKMATRNFSTQLGEGGFWKVFKGWMDEKTLAPSKTGDSMLVAIKDFNPKGDQHFELWQAEVSFLGRHYHPNLIGLLGYCWEDEKLLLVYEFMHKGSLDTHLFRKNSDIEPLSWDIRLKIAIGAARGLAFLHTLEKKVIYRDFKTYNIMLDENYNAKLSNFGLATLGPSSEEASVSIVIAGTIGYIAPECITAGDLYLKSDVYGFGVVLLELLMGIRVIDPKHPCRQQNLFDWLKPILSQETKLKTIMDAQMEGQYSFEAALQAAQLSLRCLELDPRSRPSMKEVMEVLREIEALARHLHD